MQYRQLNLNIQYVPIKQLQKWGKQEHLLGVGKGEGSTSAAIKTSSRKISYLVVFLRTVSHSGAQQKCCTSVRTRASSAHLRAFTLLPAWRCQQHVPQTGTRRAVWQSRRPIQYSCRNSSRRMKSSSEAHSSDSSISGNKECFCNVHYYSFSPNQSTGSQLGLLGGAVISSTTLPWFLHASFCLGAATLMLMICLSCCYWAKRCVPLGGNKHQQLLKLRSG